MTLCFNFKYFSLGGWSSFVRSFTKFWGGESSSLGRMGTSTKGTVTVVFSITMSCQNGGGSSSS